MRILQICTNFWPGGIQRHVLDLTHWLRERGHEVHLSGDHGKWSQQDIDPQYFHMPLNGVAGKGASMPARVATLARTAWTLRREIRARGIELIHAHETAPALVAYLATRGMDIPIAMTYHGSAPSREASVAKTAMRCADLTISPSKTSLDHLIGHGLSADKTRVIGLGIKPMPDVVPAEAEARRAELLDGKTGPLIFSLSRLDPQKGIDVMIDVAKSVTARHPEAVFVVAGGGPLDGKVQDWAEKAGVAEAFRFIGPIDTVPLHLVAADIFLLTSRWENLPISIVEAFRAGLPVVATDCGGVRELVDDSVGTLCAVEDVAGIAAALSALMSDPDMRAAKGKAALTLSTSDRFLPDAVHANFEDVYRQLIASRA